VRKWKEEGENEMRKEGRKELLSVKGESCPLKK